MKRSFKCEGYTIEAGADLQDADLQDAELYNAPLEDADLRGANLRGANLENANLRDADLRRADLRGVNFRCADMRGCNLRGAIGVHVLTATQHGYAVLAVWHKNRWWIEAGCREYTIGQARKHWGAKSYPYPPDGERILLMLDWLEKQPVPVTPEKATP